MLLDELARELARFEIVFDCGGVALFRLAVTAGPGRLDDDRFVFVDQQVGWLGRQRRLRAARKLHEFSGATAVSAEYTPRPVHEALALAGERHDVADRTHDAAQPQTAAV